MSKISDVDEFLRSKGWSVVPGPPGMEDRVSISPPMHDDEDFLTGALRPCRVVEVTEAWREGLAVQLGYSSDAKVKAVREKAEALLYEAQSSNWPENGPYYVGYDSGVINACQTILSVIEAHGEPNRPTK